MVGWAGRLLAVCVSTFALSTDGVWASDVPWLKLASVKTGGGMATEVMHIGRSRGAFDRIRIESTGGSLEVDEIRAYFADGDMQRVARHVAVGMGAASDAFELEGSARRLDRIEITCKSRPRAGSTGEVSVWAEPSAASRHDADLANVLDDDWELLGKEVIGSAVSRNVLAIGDFEGVFDALRVRVLRTDVAFHDIRIVYADGQTHTLAVRKLLRAGDASPPLPLVGEARHIREIELVHEANPEMKGKAIVQVWAHRPSR